LLGSAALGCQLYISSRAGARCELLTQTISSFLKTRSTYFHLPPSSVEHNNYTYCNFYISGTVQRSPRPFDVKRQRAPALTTLEIPRCGVSSSLVRGALRYVHRESSLSFSYEPASASSLLSQSKPAKYEGSARVRAGLILVASPRGDPCLSRRRASATDRCRAAHIFDFSRASARIVAYRVVFASLCGAWHVPQLPLPRARRVFAPGWTVVDLHLVFLLSTLHKSKGDGRLYPPGKSKVDGSKLPEKMDPNPRTRPPLSIRHCGGCGSVGRAKPEWNTAI